MKTVIKSLNELKTFAEDFSKKLSSPMVVKIYGDLGSGKTEFCRAVLRSMMNENIAVPSPTFNILHTYKTDIGTVAHFDLYRIKSEDELEEIWLSEFIRNSVVFIEWPEIAEKVLPAGSISVKIRVLPDESREIEVS